jgi:hypothetical protein
MSRVISQTTSVLPNGSIQTVTEYESGCRITSIQLKAAMPRVRRVIGYVAKRAGNAGFRRAMRVIDAQVINGVITPNEAVQLEEDLITKYDRAGW